MGGINFSAANGANSGIVVKQQNALFIANTTVMQNTDLFYIANTPGTYELEFKVYFNDAGNGGIEYQIFDNFVGSYDPTSCNKIYWDTTPNFIGSADPLNINSSVGVGLASGQGLIYTTLLVQVFTFINFRFRLTQLVADVNGIGVMAGSYLTVKKLI